ncbi:MAG: hypothetical protein ACI4CY_00695, partial [Candidatus Gastranaerophilaceae bacterium]
NCNFDDRCSYCLENNNCGSRVYTCYTDDYGSYIDYYCVKPKTIRSFEKYNSSRQQQEYFFMYTKDADNDYGFVNDYSRHYWICPNQSNEYMYRQSVANSYTNTNTLYRQDSKSYRCSGDCGSGNSDFRLRTRVNVSTESGNRYTEKYGYTCLANSDKSDFLNVESSFVKSTPDASGIVAYTSKCVFNGGGFYGNGVEYSYYCDHTYVCAPGFNCYENGPEYNTTNLEYRYPAD